MYTNLDKQGVEGLAHRADTHQLAVAILVARRLGARPFDALRVVPSFVERRRLQPSGGIDVGFRHDAAAESHLLRLAPAQRPPGNAPYPSGLPHPAEHPGPGPVDPTSHPWSQA